MKGGAKRKKGKGLSKPGGNKGKKKAKVNTKDQDAVVIPAPDGMVFSRVDGQWVPNIE